MGEIIKAEHLCYEYRGADEKRVRALTDINLSIQEGEFVAVIGTNGSGKSTLAKHFNALLLPTSGNCYVNGFNTCDEKYLWNIRQRVGMVFQNPDNQIVATIVEEDVAFGPENLGISPAEIAKRVEEALQIVGMEDYRQHAPHLLSGGQKQRVAIAGVLAMQSRCLVFDEPTAMLDPRGRREVLQTVKKINKEEGITIVYITHDMEEALHADKVIVMNQGSIVQEGSPADVFSQVSFLKSLGLDVPLAADIAQELCNRGIELPQKIITDEELVVALCP
ncbi:MAG: Polyamine-transporting ATPase [Firmicutes bacterium]|nr:Polyamine-transporting ATPase [Bacillota bacterium]